VTNKKIPVTGGGGLDLMAQIMRKKIDEGRERVERLYKIITGKTLSQSQEGDLPVEFWPIKPLEEIFTRLEELENQVDALRQTITGQD